MKKTFLIGLLFCCSFMYGQNVEVSPLPYSSVFSYVSDYYVNTGTGEKKKWRTTLSFSCKFNNDKSICYHVYPNGNFKGKDEKDESGIYRYVKTENNILVYKMDYVNSYKQHIVKYIYFSKDFSKMNEPGGDANCVFTYDRIYPDKQGHPSQIW